MSRKYNILNPYFHCIKKTPHLKSAESHNPYSSSAAFAGRTDPLYFSSMKALISSD